MKHSFLKIWTIVLIMLMGLAGPSVYAVVIWDSVAAPNVIDDDLIIDGDVQLSLGGTSIQAITRNISVTLISTSTVRGNDAGASQLYIAASAGNTIDFTIDNFDLTFQGSQDGAHTPLLIIVSGDGTVNFTINGGRTVQFIADPGNSGGTYVYVFMDDTVARAPVLTFARNAPLTQQSFVTIGENSRLGFLSTEAIGTAIDTGAISFDPTNTNTTTSTGQFVLSIDNSGLMLISGRLTTQSDPLAITLSDINTTIPAGNNARVIIFNDTAGPSAQASLQVRNYNSLYPDLLADPFGVDMVRSDTASFVGMFSGIQYGFILGSNGTLNVNSYSYLDYIGLANDVCPTITVQACFVVNTPKLRNGSAFIIDGSVNPASTPAVINMGIQTGLFFRSGIAADGFIEDDSTMPGTTTPYEVFNTTSGIGEIVVDVEAPVTINGSNTATTLNSKIEILSLLVNPTGGALFLQQPPTIFPQRNFDQFSGCPLYLHYNKAAFLINSDLTLNSVALDHSDENHTVCEANDQLAEPAYVGGELPLVSQQRPRIIFINSRLLLHTSAAFTGVDLTVPNQNNSLFQCGDNLSYFTFYYNGYCVDKGTGRQLNLGTVVGASSCVTNICNCPGPVIISADSHLDIFQTSTCLNSTGSLFDTLVLDVAANDTTLIPCIVPPITGQFALNTVFLGNNSNITIGRDISAPCPDFVNPVLSTLLVDGNFFSFDTAGGCSRQPRFGGTTGQGIIFVDSNGVFTLDPNVRVNISTMLVQHGTGVINVPQRQAYFSPFIGITQWCLDLSQTQTVVPLGASLTEYTLNWRTAQQNCALFCPYTIGSVNICDCPPVQQCNLDGMAIIQGEVDQFEVQGSRIGAEAGILIDGGWVRELIFQPGNCSGDASVGLVALQNGGRVGLSTAHVNTASLSASITLGVNGVMLIANGPGEVDLNEDVEINNICPILKGPSFQPGDHFFFTSQEERLITVKETGVLDFRQFGPGDSVTFGGNIIIVMEAGSRMLFNGATVIFSDNAIVRAEPTAKSRLFFSEQIVGPINNALPVISTPAANPHNQYSPLTGLAGGLQNTDPFRVRLIGVGVLQFEDSAGFYVPQDSFVGIESLSEQLTPTLTCTIPNTSIQIALGGSSQFIIGDPTQNGGSFQVGNTVDLGVDHTVTFTLRVEGGDAQFIVKSEGFVGLGAGIVYKLPAQPSQNWLIDNTFNVLGVEIISNDGLISHNRTFDATFEQSSLIAIGDYGSGFPLYTFRSDPEDTVSEARLSDSFIWGGGNIILLTAAQSLSLVGAIAPLVLNIDGQIPIGNGQFNQRMQAGLFSSRPMLEDTILLQVTPLTFFDFIKVKDFRTVGAPASKATAAIKDTEVSTTRNPLEIGFVDRGFIGRQDLYDLADFLGGTMADRRAKASNIGSVAVYGNPTDAPPMTMRFAQQLP